MVQHLCFRSTTYEAEGSQRRRNNDSPGDRLGKSHFERITNIPPKVRMAHMSTEIAVLPSEPPLTLFPCKSGLGRRRRLDAE